MCATVMHPGMANDALPLRFHLARAGDFATRTLGAVIGSGGMVEGEVEPEAACRLLSGVISIHHHLRAEYHGPSP